MSLVELLDRRFGIAVAGSTVGREALGGLTTFLSMAYIAVVNPVFLSAAGIPREDAILATIVSAAFATILMGVAANLPVALAPGMGLNAFFAYTRIALMPATFSISHGLAAGFVSHAGMKLAAGRAREAHRLGYAIAFPFVWRYLWLG